MGSALLAWAELLNVLLAVLWLADVLSYHRVQREAHADCMVLWLGVALPSIQLLMLHTHPAYRYAAHAECAGRNATHACMLAHTRALAAPSR